MILTRPRYSSRKSIICSRSRGCGNAGQESSRQVFIPCRERHAQGKARISKLTILEGLQVVCRGPNQLNGASRTVRSLFRGRRREKMTLTCSLSDRSVRTRTRLLPSTSRCTAEAFSRFPPDKTYMPASICAKVR